MDTKKKNMKIVIFGSTGAIGSYLAKKYLKKNQKILLFTKNLESKKKLTKLLNLKKIDNVITDHFKIEKKNSIIKKINKHSLFFKNSSLIINAIGDLGEIKNLASLDLKKFEKTLKINFLSNLILLQKIVKLKNNKDCRLFYFR